MGVFHPLLIHFPIAFLLLAAGLEAATLHPSASRYRPLIPLLLALGSIAGLLSVATGLLLASSGDYPPENIAAHRNWGIALTSGSLAFWFSFRGKGVPLPVRLAGAALLVFLVVQTGHLGGQLTHGADFLKVTAAKTETTRTDTSAYGRVIQPILAANCVSCHGSTRQKGGLRLDQPDFARKGGKHGYWLPDSNPRIALSVHRMLLPAEDEHHMPPRHKTALTEEELQLLKVWFEQEAPIPFHLTSAARTSVDTKRTAYWPSENGLEAAPADALAALQAAGIIALPLGVESKLVEVNFQNLGKNAPIPWKALNQLKEHVVSVRLSGQNIEKAHCDWLAQLPLLTRLYLDHSTLRDSELGCLKNAAKLRHLNISGTRVTLEGLRQIPLPALEQLYLFETPLSGDYLSVLKAIFPKAAIDTGVAVLPVLDSDTSVVQ